MVINVYECYFKADGVFSDVQRNGALVMLTSDSESGCISYRVAVTFFPHRTPEDFSVSYDAYFEKVLYQGKGRRSKKKETLFLEQLRETIDEIAKEDGVSVLWNEPLTEEKRA